MRVISRPAANDRLSGIACEMCGAPLPTASDVYVVEDFWDAPKYLADAIMCLECQANHLERID